MTEAEWRAFVMEGSRAGKLATVRLTGNPCRHLVHVGRAGPGLHDRQRR
ncbi:MAG: hypothetical protein R3A10_20525 [Caldilineaceae bacterium]